MSSSVRQSLALLVGGLLAIGLVQLSSGVASAAPPPKHSTPVSEVPSAWTPAVDNGSVRGFAQVGQTMVAVGDFTSVTPPGGSSVARDQAFAFDAATGALVTDFAPTFNGAVNAVLRGPTTGTVYVAGKFTQVNDTAVNRIALLNVANGSVVQSFHTPGINGAVNTIERHGKRLYVGGYFTAAGGAAHRGLAAFNARSGAIDNFVRNQVRRRHNDSGSGAKGAIGVRDLEIAPNGAKMAVIGNFKKVDGLSRDQLAVFDLRGKKSAVSGSWRTRRYEPYCFKWAFDSYMRGLSVSPDGSYFVVATSGGYNKGTLCDAAARFEFGAKGQTIQPTWVDYAGGDTLWGIEATERAVYVGGHQRWMNNGSGSDVAGQGAVSRPGLAALDTKTGLPVRWNAARHPRGVAAYELHATRAGLWMGSDTEWVGNREYARPRIAFFPLTGGASLARDHIASLPGTVYLGAPLSGNSALRSVGLSKSGAKGVKTLPDPGIDFSQWRGSVLAGGKVWYGTASGTFKSRTFDAGAFGPEVDVNPYDDPDWDGVTTGSGGTYDGEAVALYGQMSSVTAMAYSGGRLFYTRTGNSNLYWRWFSTDSGIIGSQEFTANAGRSWKGTAGMFATRTRLYFVTGKGVLRSIRLTRGVPAGSTARVDAGVDWRARVVFLGPRTSSPGGGAPAANFSASCAGLVCTFDASESSTSEGATIESYEWELDGGSIEGEAAQHEFPEPGTYTVELTITDDLGETDTEISQVEVLASQEPDPNESITFVDSAASSQMAADLSVTVPASVQAGDLMLLTAGVANQAAVRPPAGWAQVETRSTPELSSYVYSKVATAADAGSSVTMTLDAADEATLTINAYRNVGSVGPAATNTDVDTASHSAPDASVPAGSWVVWLWAAKSPATAALLPNAEVTIRADLSPSGPGGLSALVADTGGPRAGLVPGPVVTADVVSTRAVNSSIVLQPVE